MDHAQFRVSPVKNKSTQRVGAFKCLFYLESAFERTPSRRKFVLRFNGGLRVGFIRIEFDIRCRENFIDVCAIFAMRDVECVISSIQFHRDRIIAVLDKFSSFKGTVARVQSEPDPVSRIVFPEFPCFKEIPDVHGTCVGRCNITIGGIECPVAGVIAD